MTRTVFITGTDTGCGKTTITVALAQALARRNQRVACFKPVASGCQVRPEGLRNDDAMALMSVANIHLDYHQINPMALKPAIAPHVAAADAGVRIDVDALSRSILQVDADVRLVEGAGGWMVPLGEKVMTCDLAMALEAEVILVVPMRLGCINHALLSALAIESDGLVLSGWIANVMPLGMDRLSDSMKAISQRLGPALASYRDQVWMEDERLWARLAVPSN